jgi:hypothetical protein
MAALVVGLLLVLNAVSIAFAFWLCLSTSAAHVFAGSAADLVPVAYRVTGTNRNPILDIFEKNYAIEPVPHKSTGRLVSVTRYGTGTSYYFSQSRGFRKKNKYAPAPVTCNFTGALGYSVKEILLKKDVPVPVRQFFYNAAVLIPGVCDNKRIGPNVKLFTNSTFYVLFLAVGMSNEKSPLDDYVDSDPETELRKEEAEKLLDDDGSMDVDNPGTDSGCGSGKDVSSAGTQTEPESKSDADSASQVGTSPLHCHTRARSVSSASSATLRYSNATHLPKAYYNIKAAKESVRTVRHLNGGAVQNYESVGSFATIDCCFSPLPNYRHNYANKQNISSTFMLDDFTCSVCQGGKKGHAVLYREGTKVEARDLTPVAFVVSDQNFPPTLPVQNQGGGGGRGLSKNPKG